MESSSQITVRSAAVFSARLAVVGSPAEVAAKIKERYEGKIERVSPVVYQPDVALLATLRDEISKAFG